MKFLVKSMGMLAAVTRGKAFWNIWNPQYLRSREDVEENKDSRGGNFNDLEVYT